VGSAATLLIQTGHEDPSLSTDLKQVSVTIRSGETVYNAERAEVIRAALAAGADRFTINTTDADIRDYRLDEDNRTGNGLDVRYGAGQLNVYESYRIITAGEQNSSEDGGSEDIGPMGFDYDPYFGGLDCNGTATYTLTPDIEHNLLTAALVWHIAIDGGTPYNFDNTAVLYNLDLELYDLTAGEVVAQSADSGNNSEHLWEALVPGHVYEIRVLRAPQADAFEWDYALAWTTKADADRDRIPDDLDNAPQTVNPGQEDSDGDGYGNIIDADFNNDNKVNYNDFSILCSDWGSSDFDPQLDMNSDGYLNYEDFSLFSAKWGTIGPWY
jgi:hypothetical protein